MLTAHKLNIIYKSIIVDLMIFRTLIVLMLYINNMLRKITLLEKYTGDYFCKSNMYVKPK